jgi:hypothetical protein
MTPSPTELVSQIGNSLGIWFPIAIIAWIVLIIVIGVLSHAIRKERNSNKETKESVIDEFPQFPVKKVDFKTSKVDNKIKDTCSLKSEQNKEKDDVFKRI